MSILLNPNQTFKIKQCNIVVEGRILALELEIDDNAVTIINVYRPNNDNSDFFSKLEQYTSDISDQHLVIAGDFNTILNPTLD